MENLSNFLSELFEIENKRDNQGSNEEINIFNILFRGYEEVELHSRFISYLLSSNSQFLKHFVHDVLNLSEEQFDLNNCEVYPNEVNKTEKWEIDILIINRETGQAIIIENKLNAKDSIHKNCVSHENNENRSYKGQLERYYHTITNGEYKRAGGYFPIEDMSFKCDRNKTYVYYLSLHKTPTLDTIGDLGVEVFDPSKHKIDYYKIQAWLRLCITENVNSFLNTIIQQYLNLIIRMTADDKRALEITNLIAENENYYQSAHLFSTYFQHIKWHTIHRFFTKLSDKLKAQDYIEIKSVPDSNEIADVAHMNKNKSLEIIFSFHTTNLKLVHDSEGFSLLCINDQVLSRFSDTIKRIKFQYFASEETFSMINNDYREKLIQMIVDEISIRLEKR
ncbi:MAG: hypothetical protein EOO43_00080 [Flavobacterium sp.]|nr:MAG: hypothetical protein EOO43_00080 [Flavobacterium sp.]